MDRKLFLLSGLAIVAVVCNHAAGWGYPYTDSTLTGLIRYYFILFVQNASVFAVPAFLFVSGAFSTFSHRAIPANTGQSLGQVLKAVDWKAIRPRLIDILAPYLFWSVVVFGINALNGQVLSPTKYAWELLHGAALYEYYFVPMICQFYILAPIFVWYARSRPMALLLVSAAVQLLMSGLPGLAMMWPNRQLLNILSGGFHWAFFGSWMLFYTAGVLYGTYWPKLKPILIRHRWRLLFASAVLAVVTTAETHILSSAAHLLPNASVWLTIYFAPLTIPSTLYGIVCALTFVGMSATWQFVPRLVSYLSTRTFGIYLVHILILEAAAGLLKMLVPAIILEPVLYVAVLVGAGVAVPVLLMLALSKSPMRKYQRYIFG